MGDAEMSRSARNKLDSKLSELNSRMIKENYGKMQRYEGNEKTKMMIYSALGGIGGSIGGFLLGGPVGAVAGGTAGAAAGGGGGFLAKKLSEGCNK